MDVTENQAVNTNDQNAGSSQMGGIPDDATYLALAGESQNNDQQGGDDNGNTDDLPVDLVFGEEVLADSPSDDDDQDRDDDTPAIKQMRATLRDYKRQLKEAQQSAPAAAPAAMVPDEFTEPEPQLQDEGIDFDPAKYTEAWKAWNGRKSDHEAAVTKQAAQAQELQQTLITKQKAYYEQKAELVKRVPTFDKAEKVVLETLPQMLQATLLLHSQNPTMLVLALGRNKQLRDQVMAAKDPVALGRLIGEIDAKAKLAPRKPSTDLGDVPDVKAQGGAQLADLDREIEKARASNDYTRVIQLKNQRAERARKQ